jgi:transcriptional regulator with PAS, ATPase and Fis domain
LVRLIHDKSERRSQPLVRAYLSSTPPDQHEESLFGREEKPGWLELAEGGSLYLDEVGNLSMGVQAKLYDALISGSYKKGETAKKVSCRIIAASGFNLLEKIESGTFRKDLFYCLNVVPIYLPPLRERTQDIEPLVDHFLQNFTKRFGKSITGIDDQALFHLIQYPWPGNIRELENEMERLLVLANEDTKINAELLSARIKEWGEKNKIQGVRIQGKLKDALEELEKTMIREGLKRTNWNKSRLAKELGISRAGLIMKVEKYGLDKRKILKAEAEEKAS